MPVSDFNSVQREIYALTQQMVVIGVTGTKGKTTTTSLIAHLLNAAGMPASCSTTVDSKIPGQPTGAVCQTRGLLRDFLKRTHELGIRHTVLESTSYALAQDLADFCVFTGAVYTNLGHEHLDFHLSREHYLQAKRRLFTSLAGHDATANQGWVVFNADDRSGPAMVQGLPSRIPVYSYGLPRRPGRAGITPDWYALRRRYAITGSRFIIHAPAWPAMAIRTRLTGEFNVYNALAAAAAGACSGLSAEQIRQGLATFIPPPGRFEVVGGGGDRPLVVVDYAHTPESLEQALLTCRRLLRGGRVWTVFGCGGEADPSKRALMGLVAGERSDHVILTNDNPHSEDPEAIVASIMIGCRAGTARVQIDLDRHRAIATAIQSAAAGDIVIIAGKGHETKQFLGDRTISFSDREVAQALLT